MYRAVSRVAASLIVLSLSVGVAAHGPTSFARGVPALTQVAMEQAYLPNEDYVPFITALDQGYYARNGIAFATQASTGAGTSTKVVGAGSMPLGMGAASVVMQAIAVGIPITIIMTQDQEDATGVCALTSSGIKTARDLEGKSVGSSPGAAAQSEITMAMQQAGLDPTKIHWVHIGPDEKEAALLAKRVDAITCALNGSAIDLEAKGVAMTTISVVSLGMRVPLEAVFVNDDYLRDHRALVRAFLRASLQGLRYAVAHPAWAAAAVHKHYPETNAAVIEQEWRVEWQYMRSPATDQHGIGWSDVTSYGALQSMLLKSGTLAQPLNLATVFTNSVLQAIPLQERRIALPH